MIDSIQTLKKKKHIEIKNLKNIIISIIKIKTTIKIKRVIKQRQKTVTKVIRTTKITKTIKLKTPNLLKKIENQCHSKNKKTQLLSFFKA